MFTNFKAKKSLGQNFLINPGILDKIVSVAEINPDDIILEIGPGKGTLTKLLADKAKKVITIEKDSRLINPLKESFKDFSNIEIIENDILKFNPAHCSLITDHYKVVANIPYYITSNLLRIIFEEWPRPELIVLTVQKEVAKRIVAKPPDMSLLALSVQFYSEPKIIGYISRGSFRPMPKVDSAIIKLTPRNNEHGAMSTADAHRSLLTDHFFKVARAGFSGKRKQLVNNLSKNFGMMREDILRLFEKIGLEPSIRAENLSLKQWIELSKFIEK